MTLTSIAPQPFPHFLEGLGIYGFKQLEPLILAALVTEDPLLLIGHAGTGKTYLLNKISAALSLNHRHYNASYLNFDDLIGFPYPLKNGNAIKFIPTPATIWEAESVLVDELSRCKPEVQNKFFSIIHEKKIQGMSLPSLKYRWAAMNPLGNMLSFQENFYEGSNAMDAALADRFAFIIEVPDWCEYSFQEQQNILELKDENQTEEYISDFRDYIFQCRQQFLQKIAAPSKEKIQYCQFVTTMLNEASIRISPRRARLLLRNLVALEIVCKIKPLNISMKEYSRYYLKALCCSMPHRAYIDLESKKHQIEAAHESAFQMAFESFSRENWWADFNISNKLSRKIELLLDAEISKDTRSIALIQFLQSAGLQEASLLAFAAQPYFTHKKELTDEALQLLTEKAVPLMHVKGELKWSTSQGANNTNHPKWSDCAKYLSTIPEKQEQRKKRSKQLFLFFLANGLNLDQPDYWEQELQDCFMVIAKRYNHE
jgi:MoxR-like ATPase